MESRHNPRPAKVHLNPTPRPLVRILRQQPRPMTRVGLVQKLANHTTLVQRFPRPIIQLNFQSRHQASRIQSQQGSGLVVGVDFDVLVGDFLFFENGPDALHKGAEPAGIKLKRLGRLVGGDDVGCWAGGGWVEVGVRVAGGHDASSFLLGLVGCGEVRGCVVVAVSEEEVKMSCRQRRWVTYKYGTALYLPDV